MIETTFKKRLFSQFKNSPNIQNLIEVLSDPLQDSVDASNYLLDHQSISDAEGEQLAHLASKIGVTLPSLQEKNIFTLCRKGEVQHPLKGFRNRQYSENQIKYSEDFTQVNWSKSEIVIDDNTGIYLSDGTEMQGLIASTLTGIKQITTYMPPELQGTVCSVSLLCKKSAAEWVRFRVDDTDPASVYFNVNTLEWGDIANVLAYEFDDLGDSVHISLTWNNVTSSLFRVYVASSASSITYTGDGSSIDLLVSKAHVHKGYLDQSIRYSKTEATINAGTILDIDGARPGGFLGSKLGLIDQKNPDLNMSDIDFRKLIRQKATAYRSKANHETMFAYLLSFGAQCHVTEGDLEIWIDPVRYADLDSWTRNYITTRGFKPAGISVRFIDTTRHGDSI